MKLILVLLALLVTRPTDGRHVRLDLPGPRGLIVMEWTPADPPSNPSKPAPIFNHFVAHPKLLLAMHYIDYSTPIVRLSIGAAHHLRSVPVDVVRGRRHLVVAFWREIGDDLEAGILWDGRYVAYVFEPRRTYPSYPAGTWIGCRNEIPVGDVGFPAVQHADGRLSLWIMQ